MKQPCLLFLLLFGATTVGMAGPIDKVADLIRLRNIHELAKLFLPDIEMTILDQENVYSKIQAELILDKFFSENRPRAVKMLHKVNSNQNYEFGVFILTADRGTFRISCTLKESGGSLMIIEMRIENEKVK